ncbi:class I SAM-dependent methyltransferase [Actinomadura sp. NBRC 104412]|uniref:class I SAM-dependent methyltransferase n=1 Tax=Actinomadura sp. NBRC 104412 TaxID=3032203 RepID=UPI002554B816|nr:class I SAM-dependent methyltransferase [Actinomadura sp. NBRC 104412]
MAMNRVHQWYCRSGRWRRTVEERLLPWVLGRVDLGGRTLEIGPGYGATTRVLERRAASLTALEIDPSLARRLRARTGSTEIVTGDGTAMPFDEAAFSSVVCFTMLHHVRSAELQDRLFAEAHRVLEPGGVFAGSDSRPSPMFRAAHLGDTMVPIDPATLAARLQAAGFTDVRVDTTPRALRFTAYRATSSASTA